MKDEGKSKEELIVELTALRRQVAALEASAEECKRVEAELRDELAARKLAEVEIRRNEAQLSQIAANIPGAVYQYLLKKDGSQAFSYVSEGCYDFWGLTPAEIMADPARVFAVIPPEDAARVQQALRESARTMAGYRLDHRVCKPDGTVVWLRVESTPQRLPNGDILWNGVAIDITEQKQLEADLRDSESRYRGLFEEAGVSLWVEDFSEVKQYIDQLRDTGIEDVGRFFEHHWQAVVACASKVKIIDVNEAALKLHKARSKEQLLRSLVEVFSEESIDGFKAELIAVAEGRLTFQVMNVNRNLRGEKLQLIIKWSVLPGYEECWSRVLVSIVDVTDLKQTEEALCQAQRMAHLGSWQWNLRTNESIWSEELYRIYGRSRAQGTPSVKTWLDHIHPEDRDPLQTAIAEAIQGIKPYRIEYRLYRYDTGEERIVHAEGEVIRNAEGEPRFLIGTAQDITERKQAEEQLKASLREKDVLLKEIHHRVKNNLTIVSSLLELQADSLEDEQIRTALRESQARIYSMAHIHEHLYRSQNLARIDMPQYIQSLGDYLRLSYHTNGIALATEVADVALDIDAAVPCGLIINELVSNALKYAFPPGRNGSSQNDEIRIKLHAGDANNVQLLVSDNGVGLPPDYDSQNEPSLGLELVDRLTRQLGGRLETNGDHGGTTFKITFAKPT